MNRVALRVAVMVCFLALNGFHAVAQKEPLTEAEQEARDKALAKYQASLLIDPRVNLKLAESQKAEMLELTVSDSLRRAVVISPKDNARPAPLVFVYHGRRGLLPSSINNIPIYRYWPEAIIVYSQGLWIDGGNKIKWGTGWQMPNKKSVRRDVRLFDAQLEYLIRHFNVDTNRIFAMGHSNGGGMTGGLWSVRSEKLAGICISCSSSNTDNPLVQFRPAKPVFFLLAEEDQLVDNDKYKAYIRYIVGKQTTGTGSAEGGYLDEGEMMRYDAAADGAEVMTYFYPGRHRFNPAALPYIVTFFKRHYLLKP